MRRALVLLALGCGGPTAIDEAECPADSALTYASFGADFLAEHCQGCHAGDAERRRGAPVGFTFDTLDDVRRHRVRIFERAAAGNASMPPGPDDPPRAARDLLAEWLACGAP